MQRRCACTAVSHTVSTLLSMKNLGLGWGCHRLNLGKETTAKSFGAMKQLTEEQRWGIVHEFKRPRSKRGVVHTLPLPVHTVRRWVSGFKATGAVWFEANMQATQLGPKRKGICSGAVVGPGGLGSQAVAAALFEQGITSSRSNRVIVVRAAKL
jgi:hypothetical protein